MKKKLTLVRVWDRVRYMEHSAFINANYINDELQRDAEYYRQIKELEERVPYIKLTYKTAITGCWC